MPDRDLSIDIFRVMALHRALAASRRLPCPIHRDLGAHLWRGMEPWQVIASFKYRGEDRGALADCRAIRDVGARAEERKLGSADLTGSTFTISNPGPMGTYASAAVINQPNVAILNRGWEAELA